MQDTPPTLEPNPDPSPLRRRVLGWGRALLAAALLAYVLTRVDWAQAVSYMGRLQLGWLALFVLTLPVANVVIARRWQVLLRARGFRPGFWRLFGLCVVGQFYNTIFPSTVGGDVVRAIGLRKAIGQTQAAFASTVVERLTGAALLGLLGVVMLAVAWPRFWHMQESVLGFSAGGFLTDGRVAALMILAAVVLIAMVITASLSPGLARMAQRPLGRVKPLARVFAKIESFQEAIRVYRHHRKALLVATGYAVLSQLSAVLTIYAACRSLGEPVPMLGVLIATPLILLIAMLPLTPGGYGVVQWGYMVCFSALALTTAEAAGTLGVLISLLVSVRVIIFSAVGYAIYIAIDLRLDRKAAQAIANDTPDPAPTSAKPGGFA